MRIIVTGSIAFDYLMRFPGYFKETILPEHLEKISLSFLVDEMTRQRGGVAPNIAYTLALLGDKPLLVGTAGQDFGDYRTFLDKAGVDTSGVMIIPEKFTASFFANTDLSNAQICTFYAGAMADAAKVSLLDFNLTKDDLVVISPNDPDAMLKHIRECKSAGIPFLFDPSQQIIRVSADDLLEGIQGAKFLFCNEYEFELLQKKTQLSREEILQKVEHTIVTCGENGAVIYTEGRQINVPTVKPNQIEDPTGVGDAFRGGFLRGWLAQFDWETCGKMGSLSATYCLEQKGTQNHFYTRAEFVARYREQFDDHGLLDAIV